MKKLTPFLSERVWGGNKLKELKKISSELFPKPLGETWEVSTHKEGMSFVGEMDLNKYLKTELSYLVKFIQCQENLSVQVHPDDEYAKMNENSLGKTECWLILHAEKNAGIYLGFKPNVSKEKFKTALDSNDDLSNYLNFIPVSEGDFFYVPAGTVHALGAGVTLCEIQQASGVTYRVWDWNRVGLDGKPRELHVKKSFDVLNFESHANQLQYFKFQSNLFQKIGEYEIVHHPNFKVTLINFKKDEILQIYYIFKKSIIVLKGTLESSKNVLEEYTSYLVEENANLKAKTDGTFIIVTEP